MDKITNQKTIGIDGNEANTTQRVGVHQYAFNLLHEFKKLQDLGETNYKFVIYLSSKPLPDMPKASKNFEYKILPAGKLWILTKLTPHLFLSKQKPDIFFTPSHYLPPIAPMPMVCSIMDLGYLVFSEQFKKYDFWQLKLWSAWSMYVSKYIIAISETTKKDIVRRYKFAKNKTFSTPLGYDKLQFNSSISNNDVRRIENNLTMGSKNYILFLGTLKPSKNIQTLIKSFEIVSKAHPDLMLVIAGKKGWLFDSIFQLVKDLKLTQKVIFTDFVKEEDKPALIKGAKIFVLPSYWEGFGLDVVSAMACGVPVIVSDVGSLPEVVGNAGIKFSPNDYQKLTSHINHILSLPQKEYNKLVKMGITQASKFDWKQTALQTINIFNKL